MEVNYKENKYPVEIVRKKQNKNTYFRIKKDLTIYITTNSLVSDKEILKMLEENKSSIERMIDKQIFKNESTTGFYYLGKKYDVVYVQGKDIILGDTKVFVGKDTTIEKWYQKQAAIVFKERFDSCYKNFTRSIPYPKLRIRKMTSRWGVCNYKDIVVTLNLELIKREISCLDYVIYHELSHLIEANHSNKFWKVVEENYPNYKNVRRILKKY